MAKVTSLTLAHVFQPRVSKSFMSSYISLRDYEKERGTQILEQEEPGGVGILGRCRNNVISRFLNTDSEWLMWVDTDMGFRGDSAERLLSSADPLNRPVVGGLYFGLAPIFPDGMGGFYQGAWPQIYKRIEDGTIEAVKVIEPGEDGLIKCEITGSGFVVVHRSVYERIGSDWYSPLDGYPETTEDSYFCQRLMDLEIPLYVNTTVEATHHKDIWVSRVHWQMKEGKK